MSFAQFVHMLETRTLWFSKKFYFEDPWEGAFNHKTLKALAKYAKQNNIHVSQTAQLSITEAFVGKIAVNCWHANKTESLAMWEYYGKGQAAVAVCSSVGSIKKGFTTNYNFAIGRVEYVDYEKVSEVSGVIFKILLRKRKELGFESEVRLMIDPTYAHHKKLKVEQVTPFGIAVNIDPTVLIESIVPSPNCKSWEHDLLQILLNKHNLSAIPVIESVLMTDPVSFAENSLKDE